jgi:Rrf2 family iron-sulfur cluster assembly transcriptional regulator
MINLCQLNPCANQADGRGKKQLAWTIEGFKMRLSTRGRFAVTAMIDVALHEKSAPVPLSAIAMRHQVSLSYLEQIFSLLRHQALVTSVRGPGGGYRLNRNTDAITVADIIGAVEDTPKGAKVQAASTAQDTVQELWDSMEAKLFLISNNLQLSTPGELVRA